MLISHRMHLQSYRVPPSRVIQRLILFLTRAPVLKPVMVDQVLTPEPMEARGTGGDTGTGTDTGAGQWH